MSKSNAPAKQVLTVSRLTQKLQWTLRDSFPNLWVSGEISNLTQPQSGHIYLTLGDENAQLKAVIWRSTAQRVGFDLQNGMQVICHGEIDVYPPRGVYQLIIQKIEPKGVGTQQLALKKLHAKLAAEGLFDAERKQPIPVMPRRIGVVTSPTGAAVRDFLQVVNRRWPNLDILIIPARVQGEGAAKEIAQGICLAANLADRPDVLVVTRGGGSAEDLWSFNDEDLVRTIANCPLPVISAVGHEIDVTLSDLVADVRALTPSEAGELVVPVKQHLNRNLNELQGRLHTALLRRIDRAREKLLSLGSRRVLKEPDHLLNVARRNVDELEMRMEHACHQQMQQRENAIAVLAGRLQAISPLNVLSRGYSVTESIEGEILRNAGEARLGSRIITRLATGKIESQIVGIEKPEP